MFINIRKNNNRLLKTKNPSKFNHFDYELSIDSPESNPLVKEVLRRINRTGSKDEVHCGVIIANILKDFSDGGIYSAFSKRRGKLIRRYNGFIITQHRTKTIIELCVSAGLIELHNGYVDQKKGKSIPSKLRATPKLIELARSVLPDRIRLVRPSARESIRLRSVAPNGSIKGSLIDYSERERIKRMRNRLDRYNRLLSQTATTLDESKVELSILEGIDVSQCFIYRVFNEGRWDRGGRYYGGWWLEIPSDQRQYILINKSPTVEIDFCNLALALLYAMEGTHFGNMGVDGYLVPNVKGQLYPRHVIKSLFTKAINCCSFDKTISAFVNERPKKEEAAKRIGRSFSSFPRLSRPDLAYALKDFCNTHSKVAAQLFQGKRVGLYLQYLDSQIADEVFRLMTKSHIPVLGVHDSFICAVQHEDVLAQAMYAAYARVLREELDFHSTGIVRLERNFQGKKDICARFEPLEPIKEVIL